MAKAKALNILPENMPKVEALRFMPTAELVGLAVMLQGAPLPKDYTAALREAIIDRIDTAAHRANQFVTQDEGPRP
jgi:hypothetical protein